MKRLFVLLLLAVAPAYSQEQPTIVIYDPVVQQTYTLQQTPTTSLDNVNQTGTALTLYDDGTTFTPIELPFDFYYFGNLFDSVYISQNGFISFTSNANGCCNGNQLPFLSDNPYWNMNNSIFGMWSDLADFNTPGNPYYQAFADRFTVGWYGVDELGSGSFSCNEFGCTQGPGNKFTFEISLFANNSFSISYGAFDYNNQTGRTFTSGYQGDTATEYNQFYWGSNPLSLQNTTYFVQSSEITPIQPPPPEEPDPPIAPDCTVNPNDPTCIINALIPDTTDEEFLADTGFDNGSADGTEVIEEDENIAFEEEMLADANMIEEDLIDEEVIEEKSLEEMLAEESDEEEVVTEERLVVYRELTDEEKSKILEDAISKNTLESALSIASEAVSSATTAASSSEITVTESSKSTTSSTVANIESVTTNEIVASAEVIFEASKEETLDSSSTVTLDIFEIGRQLGQDALAVTLSGAESSATESLNEAENIATISSSDSVLASMNSVEAAATITTDENQVDNEKIIEETVAEEITTLETTEVVVAENNVESNTQTTTEQQIIEKEEMMIVEVQTQETTETTMEQKDEIVVAEVVNEIAIENVEQVVAEVSAEQQSSAVEFTTVEEAMEVFASNINQQAAVEQEELENNILQQVIAASQNNEEENRMGFAEAEAITIASDPALANAFNVQPNTANLELLGVLGSRAEEKSDAELRAEQVVAANKEQQDAINANYMEADQSGILAAIGSDTDVTSYRTAMIRDNNNWYKPEDIYKNIIIKDNVRGSYFLEKGNTDTYKKMVEEQYK